MAAASVITRIIVVISMVPRFSGVLFNYKMHSKIFFFPKSILQIDVQMFFILVLMCTRFEG